MKRKIARNTIILLVSRFGSRLLVFFFAIYLARILGATDFGKYLFALSFVLTFASLADFGMENFLLKEVSQRLPERIKILQGLFYPRIVLALLSYFLAIFLGFLVGYGYEDLTNIIIYGLMLVPYSIYYFFMAYFNAQEKVVKSSLIKIFGPLAYISLGIFFLKIGLGYRWLFWAAVFASTITALILIFFYRQILRPLRLSWGRLRRVIKKTWPFAALVFIAVFYLRVDVMILKRIKGGEATGLYGPASTLIETGILIPQSFALALFPISARLVEKNKERMKAVYLKGLWTLLLISLPLVLIGFFLSPLIISLFFGGEYLPAVLALRVAFLSLILFFVNALPGNVILNSRKIKGFIPLALSNLGINIALNFLLIPSLSFVGSAWAKVGSEVFGLFINNLFVYKILNEKA